MPLTRRSLLHSSFGIGALSMMQSRFLRAAAAEPRRNLVVVSVGHSLDPLNNQGHLQWRPSFGRNGDQLAEFMQPLAPFTEQMIAISGVDNLVARLVESNGHNASSRTLLNCLPHGEYTGPGSPMDWRSSGGGPSIEYILAERFNDVPLILRSGVQNHEHRRTFLADGSDNEGNPNPYAAFSNLFSSYVSPDADLNPSEQLLNRRTDILSAVQSNYEATAARAGSADRERLQTHANLVGNFIDEWNFTAPSICSPVPTFDVPAGYPRRFDEDEGRSDHILAPMHNTLIATALGCRATRIASLHYSNMQNNQFPYLNGGEDMLTPFGVNWHGFCHHDAGTTNNVRVLAQTWYMEMLADLLSKLSQTPDGADSVLDNTIVVFTSNLGNTWHSTNDIPFLVFGGRNTGLDTHKVLLYDNRRRSTADFWSAIMHLMGEPVDSFGQTGSVDGRLLNRGPLSEMFLS